MSRLETILRAALKHPGYVLMRSVARFETLRSAIVAAQTRWRRPLAGYLERLEHRPSEFFAGVDAATMAHGVERDGFAFGLMLPDRVVGALLDFAANSPCWADRDPTLGFLPAQLGETRRRLGRDFLLGQYLNARARSPIISRLSEDPLLLNVAARYLGTAPTLVGVNMWWSYPATASQAERSHAAQMFHFDLDDFKFIKFFFYLTDVDADAGPHVIVRGSHCDKRHAALSELFSIRRYSDGEVKTRFGEERIVAITGKAGTGFAEDTRAIHKGEAPRKRARLLLQLQYAINDFGIQHDDVAESALRMIA